MYSEKVMDYFMNPKNMGEISDANAEGTVGNAKCGDIMKMFMKINDATEVIEDVKFKTFGCAAAIATSSMATELIKGKSISEALDVTNQTVADSLGGLPPAKMHCSNLAREAIHSTIADYYKRRGIDPVERIGCPGQCKTCSDWEERETDGCSAN